jgi:hypothetical protein
MHGISMHEGDARLYTLLLTNPEFMETFRDFARSNPCDPPPIVAAQDNQVEMS